jgi:hypothetical protein
VRSCGVCAITIIGRRIGAKAKIIGKLGESTAEAEIAVSSGGVSGVKIEFEELRVAQRVMMAENGGILTINAGHPSVARYLGSKQRKWPGQDAVHFRTMLAEIIAWAFARHVVQSRRQYERLESYQILHEQMQLMDKWLPRVHSALVSRGEITP